MEAGDIVNIGEGAVVAGRSLGSGRMAGKPSVDLLHILTKAPDN